MERWMSVIAIAAASGSGCGTDAPLLGPDDGPPSGGREIELDVDAYIRDVAPIVASAGCSAAGDCHGGGLRGTLELSPVGEEDYLFDFEQVSQQVDPYDLLASPLLTKPLNESAGGSPHAHEPFETTDDPDYVVVRDWILAGEVR